MAVTAHQRPDFRTISDFRKRHLAALWGPQVLALCRQAGLVKLGHVALDGTRIRASASRHKAMSYGRMVKAEADPGAEIAAWFERAETAAADREHGSDLRGDEMLEWVADKQRRLAGIREAKAALEAERRPNRQAKLGKSPHAEAAGQGAAQLHRPGQPHSQDQGRLHPGRPGRDRRRPSGDRRPRADPPWAAIRAS